MRDPQAEIVSGVSKMHQHVHGLQFGTVYMVNRPDDLLKVESVLDVISPFL
jgi:hypothetical protein